MGSESQALGALLESVDALDSDPGPNLMNLMHRNGPQDFRFKLPPPRPLTGASESSACNEPNEANGIK